MFASSSIESLHQEESRATTTALPQSPSCWMAGATTAAGDVRRSWVPAPRMQPSAVGSPLSWQPEDIGRLIWRHPQSSHESSQHGIPPPIVRDVTADAMSLPVELRIPAAGQGVPQGKDDGWSSGLPVAPAPPGLPQRSTPAGSQTCILLSHSPGSRSISEYAVGHKPVEGVEVHPMFPVSTIRSRSSSERGIIPGPSPRQTPSSGMLPIDSGTISTTATTNLSTTGDTEDVKGTRAQLKVVHHSPAEARRSRSENVPARAVAAHISRRTLDSHQTTSKGQSSPVSPSSQQGLRTSPAAGRHGQTSPESRRRHNEKNSRRVLQLRRQPRRRAVVVGCNYNLGFKDDSRYMLKGPANDAFAFALTLVNLFEFHPNEILVLSDALPSSPYRQDGVGKSSAEFADPHGCPRSPQTAPRPRNEVFSLPTRHNIMLALNWLASDTCSGDTLVFYFAGHGIQIDNMSGWEGEGYDEAILPSDYTDADGDLNPITCVHIRDVLTNIQDEVQLSIFLDCTGGQSLLDPTGTGSPWKFIRGIKQKGVWPLTDATDKVHRAQYSETVWAHPTMYKRHVTPRFVPGAEVSNTKDLREVALQRHTNGLGTRLKGLLFVAGEWQTVACEASLPSLSIRAAAPDDTDPSPESATNGGRPVVHGVFTWSLIRALHDLVFRLLDTEKSKKLKAYELLHLLKDQIRDCKKRQALVKLDQLPGVTHYTPGGTNPHTEHLFWPFGRKYRQFSYSQFTDEKTRESPFPYIPDARQWNNILYAEQQLAQLYQIQLRKDPLFIAREKQRLGPNYVPKKLKIPRHPYPCPSSWLKCASDGGAPRETVVDSSPIYISGGHLEHFPQKQTMGCDGGCRV